MHIPYLITVEYFLVSSWLQKTKVHAENILNVVINVLIAELAFESTKFYSFPKDFNFQHLISFFILQDVYFYLVHYSMHKFFYDVHKQHHKKFGSFYAWYCHPLEQITLNLGSVAVPFLLVPNPDWVLLMLIILQVYTSVNGHNSVTVATEPTGQTQVIAVELHGIHHLNQKKRFGSIYLMDYILNTY